MTSLEEVAFVQNAERQYRPAGYETLEVQNVITILGGISLALQVL